MADSESPRFTVFGQLRELLDIEGILTRDRSEPTKDSFIARVEFGSFYQAPGSLFRIGPERLTKRQITFITTRPLQLDEANPGSEPQSLALMVGQFDMNETNNAKSTGFLYPASKLVLDDQGAFHYDLAGSPRSLANILDSNCVRQ